MDTDVLGTAEFLRAHPPFDLLPDGEIDALTRRLETRLVRRRADILTAGEPNESVFVVRSGTVEIRDEAGGVVETGGEGMCLGTITAVEPGPSRFTVTALEECVLLVLSAQVWGELTARHPAVRAFFDDQRAHRLRAAVDAAHAAESGMEVLRTRARDMIRKAAVSTTVQVTIAEAARIMTGRDVSSILVMDGRRLLGILTDRDLRRVLAGRHDLDDLVSSVMTTDPTVVSADALAFEVLLRMMDGAVHHLPVVEEGRPIGVITSSDLVRLDRANPVYLVRDVQVQRDAAGLARLSARLDPMVDRLLSQDATAQDIGQIVTAVTDAVCVRLIRLAEAELGRPPAYCWVALGTAGRGELSLGSRQENGIVLSDGAGADAEEYVARLAERVVDGLESCGLRREPGVAVATDPRRRGQVRVWRREVEEWLAAERPRAEEARVFLDMRPLAGDPRLAGAVREEAWRGATETPGLLGSLAAPRERPVDGELDLGRDGTRAVADVARALAVSVRSRALHTRRRLERAAAEGAIAPENAQELLAAYDLIAHARLRGQVEAARRGDRPDAPVGLDHVPPAERGALRHALQVVATARSLLEQSFAAAG